MKCKTLEKWAETNGEQTFTKMHEIFLPSMGSSSVMTKLNQTLLKYTASVYTARGIYMCIYNFIYTYVYNLISFVFHSRSAILYECCGVVL